MKARTTCLYSNSGGGKTSQFYFMAKWLWLTYQLRSRYVSYDGKYEQFQRRGALEKGGPSLIEAGIVQVFDATQSPTGQLLADTRRLSEGYWPAKTKSGEVFFASDERLKESLSKYNIGAYFLDDISSLADMWIGYAADREVGYKASTDYEEGGFNYKGAQDGHYGIVQKELQKCWKGGGGKEGFHHLPVKYVMTAAKIEKGIENYRRVRTKRGDKNAPAEPNITTMYGPKAAGQVLTPYMPGWFCDCFHLDDVEVENKDGSKQKIKGAFYETHNHLDTDIPYICRVDLLPEEMPILREKFKHGFVPLGFQRGIDRFYEWVEQQIEGEKK